MGKGRKLTELERYMLNQKKNGYSRSEGRKEPQEDFTPEQTLAWLRSVYRNDKDFLALHGYKKANSGSLSDVPRKIRDK